MSRNINIINQVTSLVIAICVRLIAGVLAAFLLYWGVTGGYAFGYEIFHGAAVESGEGREIEVKIEEGTTAAQAAKLLKARGLIPGGYSFLIQARFFSYQIKPGNYRLYTSMTSREMLQILDEGPEETK